MMWRPRHTPSSGSAHFHTSLPLLPGLHSARSESWHGSCPRGRLAQDVSCFCLTAVSITGPRATTKTVETQSLTVTIPCCCLVCHLRTPTSLKTTLSDRILQSEKYQLPNYCTMMHRGRSTLTQKMNPSLVPSETKLNYQK